MFNFTFHNLPDLSIIGWDASPEAMTAVVDLINRHRDLLNLSTDTDCFNGPGVNDVISYFEHNLLKYCVLLADADKIKAVLEQERDLRLLQIADRNVGKFLCTHWFTCGILISTSYRAQLAENYKLV